jgi:hypothetical protein
LLVVVLLRAVVVVVAALSLLRVDLASRCRRLAAVAAAAQREGDLVQRTSCQAQLLAVNWYKKLVVGFGAQV